MNLTYFIVRTNQEAIDLGIHPIQSGSVKYKKKGTLALK